MTASLSVIILSADDEIQVRIGGEVDLLSAEEFHRAIIDALAKADGAVALDLSGVTFFGSSGIAGLVKARMQAERDGLELSLRRASTVVVRVLEIAGLHDVLIGTEQVP